MSNQWTVFNINDQPSRKRRGLFSEYEWGKTSVLGERVSFRPFLCLFWHYLHLSAFTFAVLSTVIYLNNLQWACLVQVLDLGLEAQVFLATPRQTVIIQWRYTDSIQSTVHLSCSSPFQARCCFSLNPSISCWCRMLKWRPHPMTA